VTAYYGVIHVQYAVLGKCFEVRWRHSVGSIDSNDQPLIFGNERLSQHSPK
jgi:hypothetical protein